MIILPPPLKGSLEPPVRRLAQRSHQITPNLACLSFAFLPHLLVSPLLSSYHSTQNRCIGTYCFYSISPRLDIEKAVMDLLYGRSLLLFKHILKMNRLAD